MTRIDKKKHLEANDNLYFLCVLTICIEICQNMRICKYKSKKYFFLDRKFIMQNKRENPLANCEYVCFLFIKDPRICIVGKTIFDKENIAHRPKTFKK